jgi:hypothetical protein
MKIWILQKRTAQVDTFVGDVPISSAAGCAFSQGAGFAKLLQMC